MVLRTCQTGKREGAAVCKCVRQHGSAPAILQRSIDRLWDCRRGVRIDREFTGGPTPQLAYCQRRATRWLVRKEVRMKVRMKTRSQLDSPSHENSDCENDNPSI